MTAIVQSITRWRCDHCTQTSITTEPRPHTRMHICPGFGGLTAPFVREGTSTKVTAHEREDYVGKEDVRYDNRGRPIMKIVTEREDGIDCVIFLPTARGRGMSL